MVVSMINVHEIGKSFLIVVIERNNLDRMGQGDPATLESVNNGGVLPVPAYPQNLSVLIAYEGDSDELYRMARGDRMELLRWLERGRRFIKGVDGKKETFTIPPPDGCTCIKPFDRSRGPHHSRECPLHTAF